MNRLKELRELLGYKQKDFAEMLGIKPTTYNGYECETHAPNSDVLVLIAQKCGVTVDYLLGLSTDPQGAYLEIEKTPGPDELDPEEYEQVKKTYDVLMKVFAETGYLQDDGDISEEDLRFFLAMANMVDAFFHAKGGNVPG